MIGCRRLHFGVVASRLPSSNCRTGRIHFSAGTGCRHSPGPAGPNWGRPGGSRVSLWLRVLASLLGFVVLAVFSVDAYAISRQKPILALIPRPKPTESRPNHLLALVPRQRPIDPCAPAPVSTPFALPPDALALASMNAMSADVPAVKQAIELVRKRKIREATEIEKSVREPMAQKLIEWVILRSEESGAGFDRYAAFIRDAVTLRRFLDGKPTSATGRLALARVLLSEGNRSAAEREVQETWQSEELSAKLETEVLAVFPDFVTRADHAVRMDRSIGARDFTVAMRTAVRLGRPYASIVTACAAVMTNGSNARTLLEKVPAEVRQDLGYTLCRIHWLLRNNGVAEATRLMLTAPRDAMSRQDTDQWWRERRVLARELLDLGDINTAYQIVRDAAPPAWIE